MTTANEKIDLIAELGIGDDAEPKTIVIGDTELKLKTKYTGEEVLQFHRAYSNDSATLPDYITDMIDVLSADTKANNKKFVEAVLGSLSASGAWQVVSNVAVHAGLISKTGTLILGSAKH